MVKAASEEAKLLEFLYAAPVGLVEIDASGRLAMMNPYAMKHPRTASMVRSGRS